MHSPILTDILIIFGLSIVVLFICHRLKIPPIVGYLLTGMLAGPYGFGAVRNVEEVEVLADIGVILLLFTIGLEFSLRELLRIKKSVLLGGSLQVFLTVATIAALTQIFGIELGTSLFLGCLVSLSSTAIVLKQLQERGEADTPQGRTSLGILIFQDIIIVLMIFLVPVLAGKTNESGETSFFYLIGIGLLIVLLAIVSARWIAPWILYQIARTRSSDLFLISVVLLCFAVAWITAQAGLSLALGAFLAGLIISESEYSHQALGNVLPFKDLFTSFFFISVGMLFNKGFLIQEPFTILILTAGVLVIKFIVASAAALTLRLSPRTAIIVGFSLCQVGEFSFILSKAGLHYAILDVWTYQTFLAVSVFTMAATPFLIALSPHIIDVFSRFPLLSSLKMPASGAPFKTGASDHIIIVGFGVNGSNLARAAKAAGIEYIIIELNPDTVRRERKNGEPIYYGDATRDVVLRRAGVEHARILVIAIPDAAATRRITERANSLNPMIHIIARTRFVQEVLPLYEIGAKEVIPEEFETSVEIFTRVLRKYLIPKDEIEKFSSEVRASAYGMFRSRSAPAPEISDLKVHLPDLDIITVRVKEHSAAAGKTLGELALRKSFGVTLIAIRRGSVVLSNPASDELFKAGDILMLLGNREALALSTGIFESRFR